MKPLYTEDQIKAVECKHAVYVQANDGSNDDALFVKEVIHTHDGQLIPNTRIIENYERTFYITREGHRNHKEKKTQEKLSKLQKFTCTQRNLIPAIGRALGRGKMNGGLRRIARNPYIYGADITTPTLLKHEYQVKNPDVVSTNGVAVFDIETDVVHGTEDPILLALTFKDNVFLAITKDFAGSIPNPVKAIKECADKYLAKWIGERNIKLEIMVVDTPGQGVIECFKRGHLWKPDFITVWNINFDIPRCLRTLEKEGIDPAVVFSDPSVPKKYQFFNYRQGKATKQTATGRVDSIHPADQWHVAECPASFTLIDSMCVYKRVRIAKQNEPSYSLDNVMKRNLSELGKLKFAEADHLTGLKWHEFMQSDYKVEYAIYNIFDCIGVELLDEKIKDLAMTISIQSKASEYNIYNSQPRRVVDDYYFFCLERGWVVGACSDEMVHELDQYVVSMNNWIITLPTHLCVDNGVAVIEELPDIKSYIRLHVADLD